MENDADRAVPTKALFCIRPLRWEKNIINDSVQSWWCHTEFYSYKVERYYDRSHRKWGGWQVDGKIGDCEVEIGCAVASKALAKRLAFEDLLQRLKPLLRKQNTNLSGVETAPKGKHENSKA